MFYSMNKMIYLPILDANISGLRPNTSLQGPRKNESTAGINNSTQERNIEKRDVNVCTSLAFGLLAFKHWPRSVMFSTDWQYCTSIAFGNTATKDIQVLVI